MIIISAILTVVGFSIILYAACRIAYRHGRNGFQLTPVSLADAAKMPSGNTVAIYAHDAAQCCKMLDEQRAQLMEVKRPGIYVDLLDTKHSLNAIKKRNVELNGMLNEIREEGERYESEYHKACGSRDDARDERDTLGLLLRRIENASHDARAGGDPGAGQRLDDAISEIPDALAKVGQKGGAS